MGQEDCYKASSVMCRDFLENLVKGHTQSLGLGSCCDHHPTFESDVKILIFKRLLMNLLAEKIHSQALPEGAPFLMHMRMSIHDSATRLKTEEEMVIPLNYFLKST
uniref:Uncharacterized protein n=2 Tax=Magallana gigas TaxID=29159 RepID=A0A8W8JHS3_MAGGI